MRRQASVLGDLDLSPRLAAAAVLAAMTCVSSAFAQAPPTVEPRTETFTGDIKADSPKLAGRLHYACHEVDAAPGETLTIQMQSHTGDEFAFFYVIGGETCDFAGLRRGSRIGSVEMSKTAKNATLSVTAAGGRYWLMPVGWKNGAGPYTITVQHAASDPKAKRLAASVRAATVAQTATAATAPAATGKLETLAGELKADTPVLTPGSAHYICHQIDTEAGETVSVSMQPKGYASLIYVFGEQGCGSWEGALLTMPALVAAPKLSFKSAGGPYTVMAVSTALGPYGLQVQHGVNDPQAKTLVKPLSAPKGTASTVTASATAKAGQVIQDCPSCPKMVVVPAGSFMMGSASTEEGRSGDEGPRHAVTFAHPFAVGAYEVTFEEWDACVADKQCPAVTKDEGWGRGKRPVINVSKTDILRYVAWLSAKTGHKYFMPSESEWEYAARAGTDTPWSTGDALIGDDANILNNFGRSVPVGSFPPNAFGLYDTNGNVQEWVQDCSDVGYFGVPTDGAAATAPADKCTSVVRGGHWNSSPLKARSAFRQRLQTGNVSGGNAAGFRVTRALD